MLDRDLRLFQLFPEHRLVEDNELPAHTVVELREQLDVTLEDRLLILIDRDGGIKRRAEPNNDLRGILLQIDAMPTRRDEMRAKREAGMNVTSP